MKKPEKAKKSANNGKNSDATAAVGPQRDYILLDRSGSMANKWSDALGGVNAYVHGLAGDKATAEIRVTLALFDAHTAAPTFRAPAGSLCFEVIRRDIAASAWKDVSHADASPRSWTPLFDAIGKLVALANADNPPRAAIIVMTDGQENASFEHSKASAKALLDACRAKNWQVIFLGADFDNAAQATDMGTMSAQTASFDPTRTGAAYNMLRSKRATYAACGQSIRFTADEKAKLTRKPTAR